MLLNVFGVCVKIEAELLTLYYCVPLDVALDRVVGGSD